MKTLTVYYDANCGFCRRCRFWALAQPRRVELHFLPAHAYVERFDFLRRTGGEELVVVDDRGGVYYGVDAWLMVLWALKRWRRWSHRLAKPGMKPLTRRFWGLISRNRHRLGLIPGWGADRALAREVEREPEPPSCGAGERI